MFRYYEPNIGRFTQLDPIGLAGGENLYRFEATVQNSVDPLGLHTEIIIWEPVGYGSSSFGHISSNVNGVNYSWGPNGWESEKSAASYAEKQAKFRSGVGIPLNLTKEQEEKLISCYSKGRKKYQFLVNNCGDPHEGCLTEALGKRLSTSIRPVSIGFDYLNSKCSKQEKVIYKGPERKVWESNPISQFSW
ncbi:RHS repeat-associated core domain-containing protein [Gallibacterium anatis]|uniref:RHS repeat-associated core domain-containing protein n=2 Tax=Gallibacterium anatis TaxID=750 RepID=UPI0030C93193